MTSTFEQSVCVSFLVCVITLCHILNVICSLLCRIKIVLGNAENFCQWNKIEKSELWEVLTFLSRINMSEKHLLQNFFLSERVLIGLRIDLLRINRK
jgi:hypothetical protein